MKRYYFILALALALAACEKKNEVEPVTPGSSGTADESD